MTKRFHDEAVGLDLHGPFTKVFQTLADMAADSTVYRNTQSLAGGSTNPILALNVEADNIYVLTNHSPISWSPLATVLTAHALSHVQGGSDEMPGDRLAVEHTPTNYTADGGAPEVTATNQLTAHLTGIDTALGLLVTDLTAHESDSNNPHSVTAGQLGLGSVLADITALQQVANTTDQKAAADGASTPSALNPYVTVSDLTSGNYANLLDVLLNVDPVATDVTYSYLKSGLLVTKEQWLDNATSYYLKTIDYSYNGSSIFSEVHKVFDPADGTTILAQKTIQYTYTNGVITGSTNTRDI